MKKFLTTTLLLFASAAMVQAQNPVIAPLGLIEQDGIVTLSRPETTVHITLTIKKESLTAGPYARYAMKYLGITAPLTDKTSYEITGCCIGDTAPEQKCRQTSTQTASHIRSEQGFPAMTIDRLSGEQISLEQRASEAAKKIFSLRRSRMDLITGEAGENVFGAGLGTALTEIENMEQEYLSLFLGKHTTSYFTAHFSVKPVKDKPAYIICRFDHQAGLLKDSDLSGTPVLLDISSSEIPVEGLNINPKPGSKDKQYRIAALAECRIIYKDTQIGSRIIPVYQLGETVAIKSR